jgi:transcriptional regulator with GAF, ATPase, and Fis domain
MVTTLFKSLRFYVYCAIAAVIFLLQGDSYQWQNKFNARMMRWHFKTSLETPIYILYLNQAATGGIMEAADTLKVLLEKLADLQVGTIGVYLAPELDPDDADSLAMVLNGRDHIIAAYAFEEDDAFLTEDAFSEFAVGIDQALRTTFPYQIAADYNKTSADAWPQQIRIHYRVNPAKMPRCTFGEMLKVHDREKYKHSIFLIGIKPVIKPTLVDATASVLAVHAQIIDNLIQHNYLRDFSPGIFVLLLVIVLSTVITLRFYRWKMIFLCSMLVLFTGLTFLFWELYIVFPLYLSLIFLLAAGITIGFESNYDKKRKLRGERARRNNLELLFTDKVKALTELEENYLNLREKYQQEIKSLRQDLEATVALDQQQLRNDYPDIIHAQSSPMATILSGLERIAKTEEPVLILGESGTGKELIARAIHEKSARSDMPFVAVNCGALSETLLESELFGHVKGAFTGANSDKKGFFESADKGSIFLDELAVTTLTFQAKMLRILQEGYFYKVGSSRLQRVNVRIIAASNKDLFQEVEAGRFRQDLYFRLNVLPIHLPPLRDRGEDMLQLLAYFLKGSQIQISQDAYHTLQRHQWPGNIRELQNIATRMRLIGEDKTITSAWVAEQLQLKSVSIPAMPIEEQIVQVYRELNFSNDANTRIAEKLGGLHRSTVTEYLRGLTYRFYIEEHYDLQRTVRRFNPVADTWNDQRLTNRIKRYLHNVAHKIDALKDKAFDISILDTFLRKLPKKYQPYLEQLVQAYLAGRWKI